MRLIKLSLMLAAGFGLMTVFALRYTAHPSILDMAGMMIAAGAMTVGISWDSKQKRRVPGEKYLPLLVCCLLLTVPVMAYENDDNPFCDAIAVIFDNFEIVDWSDAAYARGELPSDLRLMSWVYLDNPKLPDSEVRAISFEYSAERNEVWLFAYWSMRVDENGYAHDLCPIRKFRLGYPP